MSSINSNGEKSEPADSDKINALAGQSAKRHSNRTATGESQPNRQRTPNHQVIHATKEKNRPKKIENE